MWWTTQPSLEDLAGREPGNLLALFPSATSPPIGQCQLDSGGTASLGTELGGPAGKMKTPRTSPGQHQLRDRYKSQTDGEKSISATTGKASLEDRTCGQIQVTGDRRRGWGALKGVGQGWAPTASVQCPASPVRQLTPSPWAGFREGQRQR